MLEVQANGVVNEENVLVTLRMDVNYCGRADFTVAKTAATGGLFNVSTISGHPLCQRWNGLYRAELEDLRSIWLPLGLENGCAHLVEGEVRFNAGNA